MIQLLLDHPLLLLFLVAAIGYALGRVSIAGTSLGVAAVLFVGLAFGALHPDLKLPELVYELGLVVFVYTIGISSGRQFWASLSRQGLRDNLLVLELLIAATMLTIGIGRLLGWTPAITAGVFTGQPDQYGGAGRRIGIHPSYRARRCARAGAGRAGGRFFNHVPAGRDRHDRRDHAPAPGVEHRLGV